jgi:urease accessory protein
MSLAPEALLRLIWLASPALPVGGFSYSEGLEGAVDDGLVRDEASASQCLSDKLALALGRADLPLLAAAHEAWRTGNVSRVAALNSWVLETRETRELRAQAEQMGRSMLEWLRGQAPSDSAVTGAAPDGLATLAGLTPPTWPIAFALAAVRAEAPAREAVLAYGFSWAENMVQAALKAVPLGQSAGQRILTRLARELPAVVETALVLPEVAWQAFTPLLAIRSSRHETQYSRLFRS